MDADRPISEQFRVVAKRWCDAEAAASILEESKSAVLARLMSERGDMAVSKAEMLVKSGAEWVEYIGKMTAARAKASLLKVQMEYLRMKFSEWQSAAATKRAEMRL